MYINLTWKLAGWKTLKIRRLSKLSKKIVEKVACLLYLLRGNANVHYDNAFCTVLPVLILMC